MYSAMHFIPMPSKDYLNNDDLGGDLALDSPISMWPTESAILSSHIADLLLRPPSYIQHSPPGTPKQGLPDHTVHSTCHDA
jgi:hypothetical protein